MSFHKINKTKRQKTHKYSTLDSITTKHKTIEDSESIECPSKLNKKSPCWSSPKKKKPSKNKPSKKTDPPPHKKQKKGLHWKVKEVSSLCTKFLVKRSVSLVGPEDLASSVRNTEALNPCLGTTTIDLMNKMIKVKQAGRKDDEACDHRDISDLKQLLGKAVSNPPPLAVISFGEDEKMDEDLKWLYEMQIYKEEECKGWEEVQELLHEYACSEGMGENQVNLLLAELEKQGKKNYRWVQISNNVSDRKRQLMDEMITNPNAEHLKVSASRDFDAVIPNYNWEKYIDGDEFGNDNSEEEEEYKVNDLYFDSENDVEENVDLILNWLIDEHVLELVQNSSMLKKPEPKRIASYTLNPFSKPNELNFEEIVWKYELCAEIDEFFQNGKRGTVSLEDSYQELKEHLGVSNEQQSEAVLKATLKQAVQKRKDFGELFPNATWGDPTLDLHQLIVDLSELILRDEIGAFLSE